MTGLQFFGRHGYDQSQVPEMEPIFVAFGPNFRPNFTGIFKYDFSPYANAST